MNNEEKKVEENLPKKDGKEIEGKGKESETANKEVGFITKRMPLKKWGESYIDRCITIYNIDYTTTEDDLLSHFKKVDGFEKMYVLKDPAHPELRNRGIAYVAYQKAKDAEFAIKSLNHTLIGNRRIRIERAFEKEILIAKTKQAKQAKKDIAKPKSSDHEDLDQEPVPPILDPNFLPHTRSERHRGRSRHSIHPDIDDYESLEGSHHHSYRHHRSRLAAHIDPHDYDYLDHRMRHPPIQIASSAPLFDYQSMMPPIPQFYPEKPRLEVNNEVEDLVNELSILFELYRDALLTQNISDMNEKGKK